MVYVVGFQGVRRYVALNIIENEKYLGECAISSSEELQIFPLNLVYSKVSIKTI